MRKTLTFLLIILFISIIYIYNEEIITFGIKFFGNYNQEVTINYKNEYYRSNKFIYVQPIEQLYITKKEDLLNIFYSVINSGIDKFTFYCSDKYTSCIDDVVDFANNENTLSNINSFVHTYNSFTNLKTEYDSLGEITIYVYKRYNKDKINILNEKIDTIIKTEITDKKINNVREKIKTIHNYIINHTKYDKDKSDKNISNYDSSTAYGPLIEGYGLCGGYTDTMALFLDKLNIPNYKVTSENHIWNAVYMEDKWYHLDLTWDDPVVSDGSDALEYTFFLISTEELIERDTNQHEYDKQVFAELQKNND